jgi:hypothetical protein
MRLTRMQESKLFREGDVAITTHRLVWGDIVVDLNDIKYMSFDHDDKWGMAATFAALCVGLLMISQSWARVASIAFFSLAIMVIYFKNDAVVLKMKDDRELRLTVKRDRSKFKRIEEALKKQQSMARKENSEVKREVAGLNLQEIDRLPEPGS